MPAADAKKDSGQVEDQERQAIVADLMAALNEAGAPEAMRLLELTRAESELADALGVIRREIDRIVRATARDVAP